MNNKMVMIIIVLDLINNLIKIILIFHYSHGSKMKIIVKIIMINNAKIKRFLIIILKYVEIINSG